MDTTILALDVEAGADKLVEILSTTEGMRSVWTSDCDVADGKARFGFAMAPVDLDCTVEVVDGKSIRYTVESGFPFWNGSVFEWELGPALRAESGTNLLFRHRWLRGRLPRDRPGLHQPDLGSDPADHQGPRRGRNSGPRPRLTVTDEGAAS